MILYLVSHQLVGQHPAIADLVAESAGILGAEWKYPVGLLDHLRRYHGIMVRANIAGFLADYFARHIMGQPGTTLIILPPHHQGHAYLGVLKGAGVWMWDEEPTLAALRDEMLECFLAREVMEHMAAAKSSASLLEKTSGYGGLESASSQVLMSSEHWRGMEISLFR
ncbi:MAG: hypothetical protein NVV74_25335 [Magnetospirillum sp.]|nr:hypothetical protein [Magnetospirillum sp.]